MEKGSQANRTVDWRSEELQNANHPLGCDPERGLWSWEEQRLVLEDVAHSTMADYSVDTLLLPRVLRTKEVLCSQSPHWWNFQWRSENKQTKRARADRHCCEAQHAQPPSCHVKAGSNCCVTCCWRLWLRKNSMVTHHFHFSLECEQLLGLDHRNWLAFFFRAIHSTCESRRWTSCSTLLCSYMQLESEHHLGQRTDALHPATVGIWGLEPPELYSHSTWTKEFTLPHGG